jgi:hypothetical protein
MIEQSLPPQSRQFYIRVRAQKHEEAMADYRERLTALRRENAARGSLRSGQQLLAEWQLSETFICAMATGFLEAALEACDLYEIPVDQNLSSCIETEIKGFIETQFRHALRNRSTSNGAPTLPTNIKDVFAGRIPGATFNILNPIQIRLEKARVAGLRQGTNRKSESKEKDGNMGLDLSSAEQAILKVLGEIYPQRSHLSQLAAKIVPPLEHGPLLEAVDGLHSRRLIECKPLKGAEGLVDAANILLSSEGAKLFKESGSSKEAPAIVTVLNVLIASPSDVTAERDAVESAIHEWNANHHASTGIMLHPVRWETHSYPAIGNRPQGILNKQIVESAHFLIGIFGNRLGTPTGEAPSGTIEEIEEIRKSGRHVALYFSNAPVPRDADRAQLDALEEYRRSLQQRGLYSTFASVEELRRLVTLHLPKIVDEVRANMKSGTAPTGPGKPSSVAQQPMKRVPTTIRRLVTGLLANDDLDPKEVELLWNAAKSSDGEIYYSSTLDGEGIRANERHFLVEADARTASEWLSALRGLETRGFIEPLSEDRDFFKLTGEGYAAADQLENFARWDAHSITLRAYYMKADAQELTLPCKGIVMLPATYHPDQVGADLSVMRSVKEHRSLLVEGLGSMPNINWQPADVEFKDDATRKIETFRVDGMEYIRPGRLKLPIASG